MAGIATIMPTFCAIGTASLGRFKRRISLQLARRASEQCRAVPASAVGTSSLNACRCTAL